MFPRTHVDTRASLLDLKDKYNSDRIVKWLLVVHVIYILLAVTGFILLVLLSLGPINFFNLGLDGFDAQPLQIFIPSFVFLVLFILSCILALPSLAYRQVQILQTHIALNFLLGCSVVICCLILSFFFTGDAFIELFDRWITGYSEWFAELIDTDASKWDEVQDALDCCGVDLSFLISGDRNVTNILTGGACRDISQNSTLINLIEKYKDKNDNLSSFEEDFRAAGLSIDFCIDKLETIINKAAIPVGVFGIVTFLFVIFTTYFLARVVRNLVVYQHLKTMEREERNNKKNEPDLLPELVDIYCESFRMASWKSSLKSSAEIMSKYKPTFSKQEQKEANRFLDSVSIHEERNRPKTIKLSLVEVETKRGVMRSLRESLPQMDYDSGQEPTL